MNQIAKSLLTLTIGLGLNAAAFAQGAPSEMNKPKPSAADHEKPKAENHAKHKLAAPVAAPVAQSAKPLQPLAAPKKAVSKTEKSDKDTNANASAKPAVAAPKAEKTVSTRTDKPETSVGTSKSVK